MSRLHNFSAGPAVLPESVLKEIQESVWLHEESGSGIMELSHRGKDFTKVIESAEKNVRDVLGVPEDYSVMFLQGGASLQFYMLALNLLKEGDSADYVLTGSWSEKALKEASLISNCRASWKPENKNYSRLPKIDECDSDDNAIFTHYTSNNTIYGTQFLELPKFSDKPLIADMSSDICSIPIDVKAHDLIYAGAQKNLGPSGVTLVIASKWALERSREVLEANGGKRPVMLDYITMAEKKSLYNTPNTFGIFALERVFNWIKGKGGLEEIKKLNQQKADLLYNELDRCDFWRPYADTSSRSLMNVTWNAPSSELEAKFLKEADLKGLKTLKGHRSIGGIRASIYNACPLASVEALVSFMKDFEKNNG